MEITYANGKVEKYFKDYKKMQKKIKHETETDDQANRRIDLRFIMTPPEFTDAEKVILKKKGDI